MNGTMLWFNGVKDLGFISTEEGERLCVHGSGFAAARPERRCAGTAVSFRVIGAGSTRRAEDVVFVPDVAQRRARRRHRGRGGMS